VNYDSVNRRVKLDLLPSNLHDDRNKCEPCVKTKLTRKPFPSVNRSFSNLLELIHSDVCDLNGKITRGGKRYFITFIDDLSKYAYLFLIRTKDEALDRFKLFKAEVENLFNCKIKSLSDRGGEYFNNDFDCFFYDNCIIHERTTPYTPLQNSVAERKNRTLMDMVNAMLDHSGLLENLWGEAIFSTIHILKRVSSKRNDMSPYELWFKRKPNLNYFKLWGCIAYVRLLDLKRSKLGPRTSKCVFIDYASRNKAYRFLELDSNVIIESRDAEFFESNTIKNSKFSEVSTSNNENVLENVVLENEENFEIRKSKRIRKEKSFGSDFLTYFIEGNSQVIVNEVGVCCNMEYEPSNIKEAMKSRDATFWKEAINDEMESIMFNKTWILVGLPSGSKPIGCKWIFKEKMKLDVSIDKFKASLVAKWFRQSKDIDYFDTYAPVARISSIRTLVSLASIYNLEIHQMDVKTTFLNGYLDEEVYMEQLEGFIILGQENKVCKLVKSSHGLKQAPKQWHERFDNVIISYGCRLNEANKCIYFRMFDNGIIIICLYVDDMLIFSNNIFGVITFSPINYQPLST
jgi:hypothetical protein